MSEKEGMCVSACHYDNRTWCALLVICWHRVGLAAGTVFSWSLREEMV